MVKTSLPVIILKGIVLLPHCDLRVEFVNDIEKNILMNAEEYSDNHVIVVTQTDLLNKNIDIKKLPKVGVVAKIKNKTTLPNGNIRVVLEGLYKTDINIYNKYGSDNDTIEGEIETKTPNEIDSKREYALVRKLLTELENLIDKAPYLNENIFTEISGITNINVISDIICQFLPTSPERKIEYLKTDDIEEKVKILLQDIKDEIEVLNIDNEIEEDLRKELDKAQKEIYLREKVKLIKKELGDITDKVSDVDNLKDKVSKMKCNDKIKERLNLEINKFESMTPNSPEYSMIKTYIDTLIDIPFGVYTKDNTDLRKAKQILDNTHYGLDKIKERIIEFMAVKQMSKNLTSPILCFVGPPGIGKTTLASSIAKALNRNFVKISVGGVNDEAEIMGHRRTYIGSAPGKIIKSIQKAKSMNPVFLIDEIDKLTKDYKGDPASALLEVLDKEQNKYFVDNYIEEEVDLSSVIFLVTANYIEDIPEPLKDRLEIIELSSYTEFEKADIAKKCLIPKLLKEHGITRQNIFIPDKTILKIVRNYTKEAGVRELERTLSKIIRKVVKNILINNEYDVLYKIYDTSLEKYLGKEKYFYSDKAEPNQIGLVNGLAYTAYGGDVLPIEVNYFKGNGELILTGSLGDVMKESATIALNYVKSNATLFDIDIDDLSKYNIHIHFPEGAIKKDGPSAGIAITTSLISALTKRKVDNTLAMTGEITLRGKILPIGGLREKTIGAYRAGIKTIILPIENERDIKEIPKEIREKIKFIYVKNYLGIYRYIFK